MVDAVNRSLSSYKALEEGPATLAQRTNIMKQLMIDLTEFDNIPPCLEIDRRECILARKSILFHINDGVYRRGLRIRYFLVGGEERH